MSHADSKLARKELAEHALISTRQGLTMEELSEQLGCSISTVSRYLDDFERVGLLIKDGSRYRLDSKRYISHVKLSLPEALMIFVALRRSIRQTTHVPDFMISALEKIAHALRYPTLTQALIESAQSLQTRRTLVKPNDNIWETLMEGWRQGIVVRIKYRKEKTNELTEHEFEPYLFEPAHFSHGTYVIGHSRNRASESPLRTLKVERIERANLTTQRFNPNPAFTIEDLTRNAWGIWYGQERVKVELLFMPNVVWRVRESRWHELEETILNEDGTLYWCVELAATLELVPWIRGWGPDVVVLGPESLRQQIAADMRRAAALYDEG